MRQRNYCIYDSSANIDIALLRWIVNCNYSNQFTLAAIILGLLSYRFLSWYKSSNKNITVLLYGITFAVTAIGIGVIVAVNGSVILLENPSQIGGLQSVLKVYFFFMHRTRPRVLKR